MELEAAIECQKIASFYAQESFRASDDQTRVLMQRRASYHYAWARYYMGIE